MKLLALLQAKALVTVAVGVLVVGGATAAVAATPGGQSVVQSLTHAHSTVTATATHGADATGTPGKDHASCPGLSDAQNLATAYKLSTDSKGNAVTAICALHEGTFKGTTSVSVTTDRVYGYGEIDQLLTYAQYLAAHNTTNMGG